MHLGVADSSSSSQELTGPFHSRVLYDLPVTVVASTYTRDADT